MWRWADVRDTLHGFRGNDNNDDDADDKIHHADVGVSATCMQRSPPV